MKTYVAFVLDKSGSMAGTQRETIEGFNEQIQQLKENTKNNKGDFLVSLVTFNGDVFEHFWDKNILEIEEASDKDYNPSGSTALRDAVGYTLNKLSKSQEDEDTAYLVVIISDGCENASQKINSDALREQIESLKAKGNWTFTYMGCDEAYLRKISQEMAIPLGNMASWNNTTSRSTKRGLQHHNMALCRYTTARSSGEMVASDSFYSADNAPADFTENENLNLHIGSVTSQLGNPCNQIDLGNVNPCVIPVPENVVKKDVKPKATYFGEASKVTW